MGMIIIGHRGAAGLAPENTVAAVLKGVEYRADEIEIDVRVSKDGIPVLHHDPSLADPSGAQLAIKNHTLEELRAHKADLATLDEAIKALDNRCPLIIEVKPDEPAEPVITVVRQYLGKGWQPGDFRFASFSQHILRALHATLPDVPVIINERWSGVRANFRARQLGAKRITMNQRWLWFGFIRAVCRSGRQLSAYVLNDSKKARGWERYGLYGAVTDYPDRFQH